jgi:hypothetical protein
MNIKHNKQSRMILHGAGAGGISEEDLERRALEIAVINGRSNATEDDRAEAFAELQGELLPPTTRDDAEAMGAISRDPSEPVALSGRESPIHEGEDEDHAVERLATEGVEEAQHDQMLASRRREHRESRR